LSQTVKENQASVGSVRLLNVFQRILFCWPRLHLFN